MVFRVRLDSGKNNEFSSSAGSYPGQGSPVTNVLSTVRFNEPAHSGGDWVPQVENCCPPGRDELAEVSKVEAEGRGISNRHENPTAAWFKYRIVFVRVFNRSAVLGSRHE
uniref:Uncharacterized protein n=1 Tax=Cacopsylla melanoneura TaxID=428564 RepID=A0A8D8ZHX0_9HEMI